MKITNARVQPVKNNNEKNIVVIEFMGKNGKKYLTYINEYLLREIIYNKR